MTFASCRRALPSPPMPESPTPLDVGERTLSSVHEQEQLGKTMKNQTQEPGPSRDATVRRIRSAVLLALRRAPHYDSRLIYDAAEIQTLLGIIDELRAGNEALWGVIRQKERDAYAASNGLDVAELDATCANLAMENAHLRAALAATDSDSTSVVPAVDRSRSYPDVATALTPLSAAPQGIAGDVTTDCRSPDGETVALIDAAIIALRLAARRPLSSEAVQAALADLHADREASAIVRWTGVRSSAGERAPDGETPEPDDATLLKDLEDSYRADHHFANIADHPAMKDRVDRDVEGAVEPIAARLAAIRASLTAAEQHAKEMWEDREGWKRTAAEWGFALSATKQALLTAHEDRAKAEGERDALRSAVQAIVTRAEYTGLAHGPLDDIRALLRRPDGGGTT